MGGGATLEGEADSCDCFEVTLVVIELDPHIIFYSLPESLVCGTRHRERLRNRDPLFEIYLVLFFDEYVYESLLDVFA